MIGSGTIVLFQQKRDSSDFKNRWQLFLAEESLVLLTNRFYRQA